MSLSKSNIYHEIGHVIIAAILNDEVFAFKNVILNRNDIATIGGHPNDKAYIQYNQVKKYSELTANKPLLCAMYEGIFFLSGIAGASFLNPDFKILKNNILPTNWEKVLEHSGSSGDKKLINKESYYGLFLMLNNYDIKNFHIIHCRLLRALKELFDEHSIKRISIELFREIELNPNDNISSRYVLDLFDNSELTNLKSKINTLIKKVLQDKFDFDNW